MSIRSLVTLFLAAAAASPAMAQSGWFLGAAFGQSHATASCGQPGLTGCDDKDTAWKLFGGYQFTRNMALEFGYADFGAPFSAQVRSGFGFNVPVGVEAQAWDVLFAVSFPIGRFFINFPKIGLYHARMESTQLSGGYITRTTTESNTGLTFGLGAGFHITENLTLRAEWQQYNSVGGDYVGEDHIDFMSAGLVWRF